MANETYRCPECGSTDLDVAITCWAKLYQEGSEITGTVPDESHQGDHDWSDLGALMYCNDCEHEAFACDFNTTDKAEDDLGHAACEDRGLQVTAQQLAELGPVGASIEAAEYPIAPTKREHPLCPHEYKGPDGWVCDNTSCPNYTPF